jgi:ribosomal protein S18 acetylase RimI-like enzyme
MLVHTTKLWNSLWPSFVKMSQRLEKLDWIYENETLVIPKYLCYSNKMKLSFRSYRDKSDCLAILKVRNRCTVADHADRLSTCEKFPTLENLEQSTSRPDVSDRYIIAISNGAVIAYSQVTWWDLADGARLYLHNEWVIPSHRKTEVLSEFLAKIEEHITALAARQGTIPTAIFGSNASETEGYRTDLLLTHGYKEVWAQVEMELTELPPATSPAWPSHISVAPLKPADYLKIWSVFQEAYKGGFGIPAPTDDNYKEFVVDIERPEFCFVAWDDEEVAGFILGTVEHGMGFIDELVTSPSHRRRGIARALMLHLLNELPTRGYKTARLLTAANNHSGARSLYESIGFRTLKKYMRYRKPIGN